MFKILTSLFIKDRYNYNNADVRTRYGVLCGLIGIISNLLISISKMIAGFLAGSIAITADGINSLTDSASSVVTLIAFKMANAPADPEHPFGHERLEYVSGLIISFVILIIGAFLAESSIQKIITPVEIDTTKFVLLVSILVVSILVKIWQGRFYKQAGKLINSTTLIASSVDSLSDVFSTFAVLLAIIVSRLWGLKIDGYMGLAVSIFIIINGLQLIKDTISPLLGEAPRKEFVESITDKIKSYDGVLGYHDLVIHSYGPAKIFITVHVEVDARVDITISHDMIDNIEQDFLKEYNFNVVIHMDPVDCCNEYTLLLKEEIAEIIKDIDSYIDFHDFRIVKGVTHTNVLFDVVVPNKYHLTDQELIQVITKKVKEKHKKLNLIIVIDHNYIQ
jgi:cation diffusion facilitator family transporter